MNKFDAAKKIYYDCLGSRETIDREYYHEYRKYNVPFELEEEWKQDICNTLLHRIENESGFFRIEAIGAYIQIIDSNSAINFLLDILKKRLDTFSAILVLETLKNYLSHDKIYHLPLDVKLLIKETINKYKLLLIKSDIEVDEFFKNLYYMKDYDFSDTNIIKRINLL
ncbi:TPA: hypothetical protein IAC10_12035 [Candidatus Scatousia excrementigallinarum]|uniref:Uncharacterized protein n=1 Tax=Candidatus Scatousia excrementigallinarum TaxID=2840935 RepID=A0A9D1F0K1_9BACT|nr:hypothetical protein [Candidatus Scatousia excrementigallinarum]